MSNVFIFDRDEVQQLRQQAVAAWQQQISEDTPQGWSKSNVDFTPVLATFPSLHLKPGFVLRAYQFRERNDGNGKVWAMPETAPFPNPDEYLTDDLIDDPPHPTTALDDVMQAIEGDGTPRSYLCASLFAREIAEFGAFGHGIYWGTFSILSDDSWNADRQLTMGTPENWQWLEPLPKSWCPRVLMDDNIVTVKFFTFTGLGYPKITLHIDTYIGRNYNLTTQEKMIAKGSGGYLY